MSIINNIDKKEIILSNGLKKDWSITEGRRKQKFMFVFDVKDFALSVDLKTTCSTTGLNW